MEIRRKKRSGVITRGLLIAEQTVHEAKNGNDNSFVPA